MPIASYGVWRAKPLSYTYETDKDDPISPHLSLIFGDGKTGKARAAINIKSGDHADSRLVYWVVPAFEHPITSQLETLEPGFHPLKGGGGRQPDDLRLDYIRGNLFQKQTGRLLPHDIPEENNDMIDVLKPVMEEAISQKATIYLYGSHFSNNGQGIHNVHMNQGSPRKFQKDNGIHQDGGFILQFENHWKAIFLGFASQAAHTSDDPPYPGDPVPKSGYVTWADFLDSKLPDEKRRKCEVNDTPVLISQALVNPPGPDNQPGSRPETVSLNNRTAKEVELKGWKITNQAGQVEELPSGATLPATKAASTFEVPNCPLSNKGGVITLLNAQGLKVHGVSYTKVQAKQGGGVVSFNV
jgi:uncharacterized protein YukJ